VLEGDLMRPFLRLFATVFLSFALAGFALVSEGRADAGFDRWVRDFWPTAKAAGITRATYDSAFQGVTLDPEVLEKARRQPEFATPMWQYVVTRVSEQRVLTGRDMLLRHRALLDRIEARYGVDRHIVVAIWGMESTYGDVLSDPTVVKSVIRSLATLAYADRKRAKFGRQQLVAALKILQRGDIGLSGLTGSWAGAMGHTQFIPTTYEAFAVDFDGDGRRDIWNSEADALASTANYLKKSGWIAGATWGYEVELPRGFNMRLAEDGKSRKISEWKRLGIARAAGRGFPNAGVNAVLLAPAGANGPAFLMLRNHFVIKRYNNSTAYSLAVGHLADRLMGGSDFVQSWPNGERTLTQAELEELQRHLAAAGYYSGEIDGKLGPASREAIRAYQEQRGLTADGFGGIQLLRILRSG
jgi:membrane-bound lytic murein transglycosylase B